MKDAVILIPAAGFGRRVGQPEAKEMLGRSGFAHMIDFSLDIAAKLGVLAHVIVREEKQSLLKHLTRRSKHQALTIQIVGETREWPDTILASEPFWQARNLVILPDSDFSPVSIVGEMFAALSAAQSAWALFEATDLRSWGVIDVSSKTHSEKPKNWPASARPWGLFGFQNGYGRKLCEQLLESTVSGGGLSLENEIAVISLGKYQDLTRPLN